MSASDSISCVGCDAILLYRSSLVLIGGYNALLCDECCNAWHVYITNHPLWNTLREIEVKIGVKLTMCKDGVDRYEEILPLTHAKDGIQAELFNEAKRWIDVRKKGGKE